MSQDIMNEHSSECIDYNMQYESDTIGECICDDSFMSARKIEVSICHMTKHELGDDDQPEFLGDGTQTIVLQGKCKICGFDIYISHLGMNTTYEVNVGDKNIYSY